MGKHAWALLQAIAEAPMGALTEFDLGIRSHEMGISIEDAQAALTDLGRRGLVYLIGHEGERGLAITQAGLLILARLTAQTHA